MRYYSRDMRAHESMATRHGLEYWQKSALEGKCSLQQIRELMSCKTRHVMRHEKGTLIL